MSKDLMTKWHHISTLKQYYKLKIRILEFQLRLYEKALEKMEAKNETQTRISKNKTTRKSKTFNYRPM